MIARAAPRRGLMHAIRFVPPMLRIGGRALCASARLSLMGGERCEAIVVAAARVEASRRRPTFRPCDSTAVTRERGALQLVGSCSEADYLKRNSAMDDSIGGS